MRFTEIISDDSEIFLAGPEQVFEDGEDEGIKWTPVIQVLYMDQYEDNPGSKYLVQVMGVSPESLGEKQLAQVRESMGIPDEEAEHWASTPMMLWDIVHYGSAAPFDDRLGNNLRELLKWARAKAEEVVEHQDYFFYRQANQIGSTNLEFMGGQILAGIGIYD